MQDNFLIDRIMTITEFESLKALLLVPRKFVPRAANCALYMYLCIWPYIQTPGIISKLTLFPLITQNLTPLTEITQLIQL